MREPSFWWRQGSLPAALLSPLAAVYGAVASQRLARSGAKVAVPVVCIGNPTVGGAGKTPTALAVGQMLKDAGETPAFLSRGYGGALAGPVQVDRARHRAADVGDEPLELARAARTIVARDRVAGAQAAATAGASVIVMDDGFQNPSLAKDFSVLVIDAKRGVGDGYVIPAGPLRAPLAAQLDRANALIVVGEGDAADGVKAQASQRGLPIFTARLVPDAAFIATLTGKRVLAFAGIGDPEKFFATLRAAGVTVAATRGFDDHHRYTAADTRSLCAEADRGGLTIVTTAKDLARMQGDAATAQLDARAHALPVTLTFDDADGFRRLLLEKVAGARR